MTITILRLVVSIIVKNTVLSSITCKCFHISVNFTFILIKKMNKKMPLSLTYPIVFPKKIRRKIKKKFSNLPTLFDFSMLAEINLFFGLTKNSVEGTFDSLSFLFGVSLYSEQYRSWMLANPLFVCLTCIRPGAY